MKKFYLSLLIIFIISATPVLAVSKTNSSQPKKSAPITSAKKSKPLASPIKTIWSPPTPKDYTPITWAQAPGIASFSKTPKNNGTIDFLTYIHLPQNQIKFIFSTSTPINSNSKHPDTDSTIATSSNAKENLSAVITDISDFNNLSLQRLGAEVAKAIAPSIKFLWDAQFFNMKSPFSDLSMAIKYSIGTTTTIVSGSRSVPDMAEPRRMLVINNQIGSATIKDFDSNFFISSKNGDQALEGFSPTVAKSDNASAAASRLFLGVSNNGRELAVYCSRMATVAEASNALTTAGISPDHQLQADGGGSTACGYNLPGQFFVEPTRTLPLLMGAETILTRGKVTAKSINSRSGPAAKYPVVAKLSKDTTIRALEEKNGWYRIGDKEWILKTLIK